MSLIIVVVFLLKIKWIINEKLVILSKINARLHVVIAKWYKDEYIFDGAQLETCMFIVNQEQSFEVVFLMEINY
jgi:hypothetical protein